MLKKFFTLGIDTSGLYLNLSVSSSFEGEAEFCYEEEVRNHASRLPLAIDTILEKSSLKINDISAVGVVIGPGSFTGLRVGISTAVAFKLALKIPLYSFSSLYCLSKFTKKEGSVVCLLDARKGEFYCQKFKKIGAEIEPLNEPHTIKYNFLESYIKNLDWAIVLKGGAKIEEKLPSQIEIYENLNLAKIAAEESFKYLAEGRKGEEKTVPLYVREADAVIQM